MKERVFSQFNFTDFFSFLLNNVFAANKPNTKRKKYFLYELSRLPCHKQPHKKKGFEFLLYVRFDLLKIFNKIYEKILYSVCYKKSALKFWA